MQSDEALTQLAEKFKNGYYKRPQHVKIPTVWMRFQGKTPRSDGTYPKFRVQDVTEDWVEPILSCMPLFGKGLIGEEILNTIVKENANIVRFTVLFWRAILKDQVALICLTDDDGETPKLAGFQMNEVSSKLRTLEDVKHDSDEIDCLALSFINSIINIRKAANVFERYNVSCYMDAFALFVNEEFRNQGVALHLQKAKIFLCKALGIQVMANGFASDVGIHIGRKIGFELLNNEELANTLNKPTENLPEESRNNSFMGMRVD